MASVKDDTGVRDPASFRDPSGCVFVRDGVVYRQINRVFAEDWDDFVESGLCEKLIAAGLLIPHNEAPAPLALDERAYRVIRPQEVPFVSYPYEWSFSQLKDAALVTLQAHERALDAGMSLKDASAYNVQFVDGRPLLIDTLSFERATPRAPWVAYRQFCQHFLAPLALMAYRDVRSGRLLRDFIDGLPLDLTCRFLPARTRLRLGLGAHLHAHARATRRVTELSARKATQTRISETGQRALLDSLRRTIEGLRWRPEGTTWAGYTTRTSYTAEAAEDKLRIVDAMVAASEGTAFWDVGANMGTYSAVAAKRGHVVALDGDPSAVERLYLGSRAGELRNITPLLVDLTNPSPALGWAHQERRSLIDRGPAPVAMALAIVHHLAIGANVPLPDISAFFAAVATGLIIEFVPKEDPQAASLLAARRDVFPDYTLEGFRAAFDREFRINEAVPVADSPRVLFRMTRR